MIKKSLTFHNYNKTKRDHNVRNPKCVEHMDHIKKDMMQYNEVLKDEKIRDAYNRIFGEALEKYNVKQTNKDRIIKDYYTHIKKHPQMNLVYEIVVQIGDRNTTGSDYEETLVERDCLKEYYEGWQKRNTNLECVGAYIHADEATLHMHLAYIPVATEYKNGLEKQPGMVKALGQQGFHKKGKTTAQMQWQEAEREVLKNICRDKGIEIIELASNRHKHMEKEEYILYSKIKENQEIVELGEKKIEKLKKRIGKGKEILKELKGEVKDAAEIKQMTLGTNIFGKPNKEVKLDYKEYIDLKATAEKVNEIEEIKNYEIEGYIDELEEERYKSNKWHDKFNNVCEKRYEEKERYKGMIEEKDERLEELERTLDDVMYDLDDVKEALKEEKSYVKKLEDYMLGLNRNGHNLFDEFLAEQERLGKMNRRQKRARERNKDIDEYEYGDDARYY